VLNEDTWKQIKFNILKDQLMALVPGMRQNPTELDEIVSCVLERDERIPSYFHGGVGRTKQEKIDNEEMLDVKPRNPQHTKHTEELCQRYKDKEKRKITLYQLRDLVHHTMFFHPQKNSLDQFHRCSEKELDKIKSSQYSIRAHIKILRDGKFCC
jgi:hypothetical protein